MGVKWVKEIYFIRRSLKTNINTTYLICSIICWKSEVKTSEQLLSCFGVFTISFKLDQRIHLLFSLLKLKRVKK